MPRKGEEHTRVHTIFLRQCPMSGSREGEEKAAMAVVWITSGRGRVETSNKASLARCRWGGSRILGALDNRHSRGEFGARLVNNSMLINGQRPTTSWVRLEGTGGKELMQGRQLRQPRTKSAGLPTRLMRSTEKGNGDTTATRNGKGTSKPQSWSGSKD
jgi:hypothetical protein